MAEKATRLIVRSIGSVSIELEMEATVFNDRVCLAFKCEGSTAHRELANMLRSSIYEPSDTLSIADHGGVRTMKTRFVSVGDLMDLLRKIGLRVRELPERLPLLCRKCRINVSLDPPATPDTP